MKTTKMTQIFHLLFLLFLLVTFISEFENTVRSLIDVHLPPPLHPRLLIFRIFPTYDILIPHLPFIKSRKIFQPGHL